MHELVVILVNLAALIPGYAVLVALNRNGAAAVWDVGLAYLAGVAAVLSAQAFLVPLGVSPNLAAVVVTVSLVSTAVALTVTRRGRSAHLDQLPRPPAEQDIASLAGKAAIIGLGLMAVTLLIGLLSTSALPLVGFDSWAQWIPKGELLAHGGLVTGSFWGGSSYMFANPDYPLGLPLFYADQIRWAGLALGSSELSLLGVGQWLLLAAFAATLIRRSVPRAGLVLPVVFVICFVCAPGIQLQERELQADVPLAIFATIGTASLLDWLEDDSPRALWLGALLLAAAASMKDEGTAAALVVSGLVIAVANHRGGRAAATRALWVFATIVTAVAPWRIWLATHNIHGYVSIHDALDPARLVAHASRVGPVVSASLSGLATPGEYLLLPSAAIALGVAVIAGRPAGRWRAGFYLALMVAYIAVVVWAQWASPLPLSIYTPEADRFMTTAAAFSLLAILDLLPYLSLAPVSAGARQRERTVPD